MNALLAEYRERSADSPRSASGSGEFVVFSLAFPGEDDTSPHGTGGPKK